MLFVCDDDAMAEHLKLRFLRGAVLQLTALVEQTRDLALASTEQVDAPQADAVDAPQAAAPADAELNVNDASIDPRDPLADHLQVITHLRATNRDHLGWPLDPRTVPEIPAEELNAFFEQRRLAEEAEAHRRRERVAEQLSATGHTVVGDPALQQMYIARVAAAPITVCCAFCNTIMPVEQITAHLAPTTSCGQSLAHRLAQLPAKRYDVGHGLSAHDMHTERFSEEARRAAVTFQSIPDYPLMAQNLDNAAAVMELDTLWDQYARAQGPAKIEALSRVIKLAREHKAWKFVARGLYDYAKLVPSEELQTLEELRIIMMKRLDAWVEEVRWSREVERRIAELKPADATNVSTIDAPAVDVPAPN